MTNNQKKQNQKSTYTNVIETLKDAPKKQASELGKATYESLKQDVVKGIGKDIVNQIIGGGESFSADIAVGETLVVNEVTNSQNDENKIVKMQLLKERQLRIQEKEMRETKMNELRIQLNAVSREIIKVTQETSELAEEVKVAAMQAPTKEGVGIYHVIFFAKFLDFLKSYRKKIEHAKVWLKASNNRASQKGWLAGYKKHGAKYLLSGEHYVARNAG